MIKFSRREIILFSLIIAGIILTICLFIILFSKVVFKEVWLFLTIIFAFYIVILIIAFFSIWVFLKRISVMK